MTPKFKAYYSEIYDSNVLCMAVKLCREIFLTHNQNDVLHYNGLGLFALELAYKQPQWRPYGAKIIEAVVIITSG
jgi:hypothetical protein